MRLAPRFFDHRMITKWCLKTESAGLACEFIDNTLSNLQKIGVPNSLQNSKELQRTVDLYSFLREADRQTLSIRVGHRAGRRCMSIGSVPYGSVPMCMGIRAAPDEFTSSPLVSIPSSSKELPSLRY